MDQKAKICAVSMVLDENQEKLLRDLEKTCNVEIDIRETNYSGKDWLDYEIQRSPDTYVNDSQNNQILQHIRDSRDLDGIILFPDLAFDKRFLLTKLPTLLIDSLPNLQFRFKDAVSLGKMYKTNFITATFNKGQTDVSKAVGKKRKDDLAEKVRLFDVIRKMKNTRIMDIQVKGFGTEPHEHWWRLNQEEYLEELKVRMGMDVIIEDYRNLFRQYKQADSDKAKKLAKRWIEQQKPTNAIKNKRNVASLKEEEIIKAAKLYLAAEKMMKETGCNALTLDASSWASPAGRSFAESLGEKFLVSGSLPITEFRLHGVPGCCQSDMNGLVTQILGEYISGRPGFHGDVVIDPYNDVVQVGHCNAPLNPYGDDKRIPYSIGGEQERRPQIYADLPQEGLVTGIKVNVLENKISIWNGELIPGESIYKDFFESYCCSKLVAKTNAKAIYDNYDYRVFGNHICLFYGDFRNRIKEMADLLGFSLIEQDKLT
jgi:hypothetical protein